MYVAFAAVCIVYILLNIIVGIRIRKSLTIESKQSKIIFWTVYTLIFTSFFTSNIFSRIFPTTITKIIYNIGCYYLGLLVYIVILFIISFILTTVIKKGKLDYYSISLVLSVIISIYGIYSAQTTRITNYDVKIDSKIENSDSIKIALISDIHEGYSFSKKHLSRMVKEVNDLNPDVVIIAGDLVDGNLDVVMQEDGLSPLSNLNSTYGTYFALGNHDCYTKEIEKLSNTLRDNNVNVLNDDCVLVNDSFYIIGRVDKSINDISNRNLDSETSEDFNNGTRNDLVNIISGIDKAKPTLLIDHSPNNFKEAVENDIDIQFSGHTHNGQLFPFNYIVKKTATVPYGYDKINNTNIVVSSGYGIWGPPMRTTNHSEISLITLTN